jgi:hypothetical protein
MQGRVPMLNGPASQHARTGPSQWWSEFVATFSSNVAVAGEVAYLPALALARQVHRRPTRHGPFSSGPETKVHE